ncbi:hypothetical protein [Mycobacterium sp.]|uniref:hypothetical protein n=1 Tax=Mycobacterium sp. TaxID=1785 RepID=UPI0031CE2DE9
MASITWSPKHKRRRSNRVSTPSGGWRDAMRRMDRFATFGRGLMKMSVISA